MKKVIRFVAQCINADNGDVIEESILKEEALTKAKTLKELGYLHIEQIDFLQKISIYSLYFLQIYTLKILQNILNIQCNSIFKIFLYNVHLHVLFRVILCK